MENEYTLADLKNAPTEKISRCYGTYVASYRGEGASLDLDTSDILTPLIQSVGRFAEKNASDLFVQWGELIGKLHRSSWLISGDKENEGDNANEIKESFFFGIFKYGVDSKYTIVETVNLREKYFYRKVYKVEVRVIYEGESITPDCYGSIDMTLYEVNL